MEHNPPEAGVQKQSLTEEQKLERVSDENDARRMQRVCHER